jgi:hypothetical protein
MEPFGDDKSVHPAKKAQKDYQSKDHFSDKVYRLVEIHCVCSFHNDSYTHVKNGHDDGNLHLDDVDKLELVIG